MFDLSHAPDPIHRLTEWLGQLGFGLSDFRANGHNNQFGSFVSDPMRLDLTADRGAWSLTLGMCGMTKQHSVDGWEAWFGGFELAGRPSNLDDQVSFVIEHWRSAIENASADVQAAENQIQLLEDDWVYRRIGWRPSRPGSL